MIKAALSGRNGSVVVLHCGPKATPRILRRIINGYRARGFGFVTVPVLLGMHAPTRAPHRPWVRSLLHTPPAPVAVAGACPPRTATTAAGLQAASRMGWMRPVWSRRPANPCWKGPSQAAARIGANIELDEITGRRQRAAPAGYA